MAEILEDIIFLQPAKVQSSRELVYYMYRANFSIFSKAFVKPFFSLKN